MLNQVILVGRVSDIKSEDDKTIIILNIQRRCSKEEYATDAIEVELTDHITATALEYITTDTTLGVKARVAQRVAKIGNEEIKLNAIIAEKLTFITSKKD